MAHTSSKPLELVIELNKIQKPTESELEQYANARTPHDGAGLLASYAFPHRIVLANLQVLRARSEQVTKNFIHRFCTHDTHT